jgi:hypothetical protein
VLQLGTDAGNKPRSQQFVPLKFGGGFTQEFGAISRLQRSRTVHQRDKLIIDLTNGNVLKPDGWKRPNLKVRNSIQGNIYDDQRGCGLMRVGEGRLWRSPIQSVNEDTPESVTRRTM